MLGPAAGSPWSGTSATSRSRGSASSAGSSAPRTSSDSDGAARARRRTSATSRTRRSGTGRRRPRRRSRTWSVSRSNVAVLDDEARRGQARRGARVLRRLRPRHGRHAAALPRVVLPRRRSPTARTRTPIPRPTPTSRTQPAERRTDDDDAAHRLPLSRPQRTMPAHGAARPPGHRGRPRHLPHPAHRLARRAGAARGAHRRQRRAQHPAPARPARHARRSRSPTPPGCWPGTASGQHHEEQCARLAGDDRRGAAAPGSSTAATCPATIAGCAIRHAVVSPLVVEERVVGTLQVFATAADRRPGPGRRRGRAVGLRASSSSPSSTPPAPG